MVCPLLFLNPMTNMPPDAEKVNLAADTGPITVAGLVSESLERPHHPYSPSKLQSLEACPCYEGKETDKPHVRTVAGTRAHGMTESGEDDERLSDEDATAAAECLDFVEYHRRLMAATDKPDVYWAVEELKEAYLPVDDLVFSDCNATTAGYVDHVLINYDGTYANLFDWKFGMWPVEDAENNLQGIAYCLGLFKLRPTLQTVHFFFKQPHLQSVSQATFTRDQIPELYLRIQVVVARAREARAAIVGAEKSAFATAKAYVPVCNFCSRIAECPVVAALVCKVGAKFHPAEIPSDITPTMLQDPNQTTLAMRLAQVVTVWAGAFKRLVSDRIIRGAAPMLPGYKVQTMRRRKIADMSKYKEVALRHLTPEEFDSTLESSLGAVEEIVKEKAPRGNKTSAVEDFQTLLEESGAVVRGDPYSFLKAIPTKKTEGS